MSWEKDLDYINKHLEWAKDYISDLEDHVKEELADAQHEITELTDTIAEHEKEIERLDGVIVEHVKAIDILEAKVVTLEFDLMEAVGELQVLRKQIEDYELDISR
jgi:chromosome segregation ATPase